MQLEQYLPELAVAVQNPEVCPATCRRMLDSDSEEDFSDDESESDDDASRLLKSDASGNYGWREKEEDESWYGND